VTEEQAATHTQTNSTFLIVDPLDGTKEFVHRRGDFTVNIALVEDGVPTRGIVFAPAKNRMFFTDETGASVEEFGDFDPHTLGETRPIHVAEPRAPLTVVASKSHRDQATDDYINKYEVGGSGSLPAFGPHDGMGHSRRRCSAARCRRQSCPL